VLDLSKSRSLNPNDDRIYTALGQNYQRLQKFPEAFNSFSKATELSPDNGDNWLNRSQAELALGKKADAKADAIKAQSLGARVTNGYLESLGTN
jgi:tetratricopeptide (TPR) repeat protein